MQGFMSFINSNNSNNSSNNITNQKGVSEMEMEKETVIRLCHASVSDGDWMEVLPETVKAIKEYLKTNQFVVLTSEEQPSELVNSVINAFNADRTMDVDNGCMLGLGTYSGIPAAVFNTDLEAVYFASTKESAVISILKNML